MTKTTALLRLQNRTEQMMRLVLLNAPEVILAEQRRMIAQARGWVDDPPAEIPD